jgi:hypothetical protein
MIILGIVLIVLGLILPSLIPTFAFAHIVLVIGVILLVVGVILAILGATGRAVGGRRHYYEPAPVPCPGRDRDPQLKSRIVCPTNWRLRR